MEGTNWSRGEQLKRCRSRTSSGSGRQPGAYRKKERISTTKETAINLRGSHVDEAGLVFVGAVGRAAQELPPVRQAHGCVGRVRLADLPEVVLERREL